jgi:hypothetical protein
MTREEYEALVKAVTALQTAVTNLASKQQLRQLYTLRQQEIEDIKVRLTALEQSLAVLQRN